jgi:hypothetical protein
MADVTRLSPELVRRLRDLARALSAAARSRALYSAEHPAAQAALGRLQAAIHAAAGGAAIGFAVTPTTILVDGVPTPDEGLIAEAAAYLHARDILAISFLQDVPEAELQDLLALLADNPLDVRARGGPAVCWNAGNHRGVAIEQIDVQRVLEDREVTTPATRDDVWRAIVRGVIERHKVLDPAAQRRLLAIAGDVEAIAELAADVMEPGRTPDGNPMVTTQAAAVLAAYRHLSNVVSLLAPERRAEAMGNIAAATGRLDPAVTMQVLTGEPAAGGGEEGAVVTELVERFDDVKVAQLLATTLAIDGQASQRLASVFDTIAPDEERKRRVLRMTRTMLRETDFGQRSQFDTLWSSMEELLLTYNERPFVSATYRTALDESIGRAAQLTPDLPPETRDWVQTLGQDNVRTLSVTLLIDLLNLERDAARAPEIADDVAGLAEGLLVEGDYAQARRAVEALAARAADRAAVTSGPCRDVIDRMAGSSAIRETVELLGDLTDDDAGAFAHVAAALGPAAVDPLLPLVAQERETKGRTRAFDIVRGFGPAAIGRLGPLVNDAPWHAQRNAARLMGDIGSPDAVPFLQSLLRGTDPRVAREAVRALAGIDDPSAARAVHTVLRATRGDVRRAVVEALVAERDPRVVPVLLRILGESDPLGGDHPIVLDTLMALGTIGDDLAVNDVSRVMRRRSWFRRRKVRALKQTGLLVLRRIGSPAAASAIQDAASSGDRLLRRMARTVTP